MRLGQREHVRPADNDVEQFGRLKEVDVTGELGNARLACTPSQRSTQCVMARVAGARPYICRAIRSAIRLRQTALLVRSTKPND